MTASHCSRLLIWRVASCSLDVRWVSNLRININLECKTAKSVFIVMYSFVFTPRNHAKTSFQPFVLSTAGRQWIFGGELSRVEGRTIRPYWALLFTDLLLFATVSRDRVLFVTEEPVALGTVSEAQFNIRKKGTDLIVHNFQVR